MGTETILINSFVTAMKRSLFTLLSLFLACSSLAGQETISYSNAQLTLIDNINVASLDPGVVEEIAVKPGDVVAKDELLVKLNSELFAAQANADEVTWKIAVQQSESDVDFRFSQKSFALRRKQLQKSQNAVREFNASISETEIDRLRLEQDQAMLSIEQAQMENCQAKLTATLREEQKKVSEIRLRNREILSPIDGIVAQVAFQKGESVSGGEAVVRVISLDKLRVKAFFSSEYALSVKVGQTAEFTFKRKGKEIRKKAMVSFVSPEVRPSERGFELWAEVDNSDRELLPGFKGALKIEIDE